MKRIYLWLTVFFLQFVLILPAFSQKAYINPMKKKLKEGKVVVGATITVGNPDVAVALAGSGVDFLWIEMEHSPLTLESVRSMILATRGLNAVPFVRVPVNEPWQAKRVMDIGCYGVIFPFSGTKELVQQAVASCKYPPQGIRGFSPTLAGIRWDMTGKEYADMANDNIVVITIIEQKAAIENIEEIAAVPGVDVLFIGVNDLSYSLGVGGQLNNPIVEEAVDKVIAAGKKFNVTVGYPSGSPEQIKKLIKRGIRFFQGPGDLGLLRAAAEQMVKQLYQPNAKGEMEIPY